MSANNYIGGEIRIRGSTGRSLSPSPCPTPGESIGLIVEPFVVSGDWNQLGGKQFKLLIN